MNDPGDVLDANKIHDFQIAGSPIKSTYLISNVKDNRKKRERPLDYEVSNLDDEGSKHHSSIENLIV
jgi:hypothetical protein